MNRNRVTRPAEPAGLSEREKGAFRLWDALHAECARLGFSLLIAVRGFAPRRFVEVELRRGVPATVAGRRGVARLRDYCVWRVTDGVWTRPGRGPADCPDARTAEFLIRTAMAEDTRDALHSRDRTGPPGPRDARHKTQRPAARNTNRYLFGD